MEQEIKDLLRDIADVLILSYKLRAPVDTGALRNSIRAEVRDSGEIAVIYNRYGAYQDLGVQGWGVGKNYAPNSPFQFKVDTGGWAGARKWGIPPKYWASNPDGTPRIPEEITVLLEDGIADIIEQIVSTTTERTAL